MEYALDDTQEELRCLAAELFGAEAAPSRLTEHAEKGTPYDEPTWRAMAQAGLLGAAVPEGAGGAGLGAVETAVVLREAAARTAPVPAFATLALGVLPIALCGTAEQCAALAPVAAGESVLTAAVFEAGRPDPADPADPATTARPDGDTYVLNGVKTGVPYGAQARTVLVPARTPDGGTGVFLVPGGADGLTRSPHPTGTNNPAARLGLQGVRVPSSALLGGDTGGHTARTLRRCALMGLAATVSGALAGALALTTEHVRTRRQFGRALAELQAVTMRIGDVYVAARALDVALWAGAWRLSAEAGADAAEDADSVLASAALLITDQALDAFYATQHLHGGLGVDVTYPLFRHFAIGKWAASALGGTDARLDALGHIAAADTPAYDLSLPEPGRDSPDSPPGGLGTSRAEPGPVSGLPPNLA